MSIFKQKTISKEIKIDGCGLHSGKNASLTIKPASPNTGIIFKRIDLNEPNEIVPDVYNVSSAVLCTTISNNNGAKISTIEHLMGALFGEGVDNAIIEIDNEEVPILDGSGKIFVEKIREAGLKFSNEPIEPSKINLEINFEIKYQNSFISTQKNNVKVYEDNLEEIYESRTFCLYEDIESLRSMGLAQGGSLDNAIVVKNNEIINKEKLRNRLEFVNHKILDCMGDLYLSGYRIIGKLICSQGGHKLTNDLLREVFLDKNNYSIIEINEKTLPQTLINKQNLKYIA